VLFRTAFRTREIGGFILCGPRPGYKPAAPCVPHGPAPVIFDGGGNAICPAGSRVYDVTNGFVNIHPNVFDDKTDRRSRRRTKHDEMLRLGGRKSQPRPRLLHEWPRSASGITSIDRFFPKASEAHSRKFIFDLFLPVDSHLGRYAYDERRKRLVRRGPGCRLTAKSFSLAHRARKSKNMNRARPDARKEKGAVKRNATPCRRLPALTGGPSSPG